MFHKPFGLTSHRRGAFTLIEMMIVITIIGILSGVVLAGLNSARTSAKIAKTKSLVTRLHYVVMDKYDSYRTRRPAMDLRAYAATTYSSVSPAAIAQARVNAIRDLIRLEMPDRWADLEGGPLVLNYVPSVWQRYNRLYKAARNAALGDPAKEAAVAENAAAECLYMIVMSLPGAAEQFHANEIGDVDNDGLPEFIDAWGRPVRFLRWPAGFYMDADGNYYGDGDLQFGPQILSGGSTNPKYQPDPFDPRKVCATTQDEFALYPLIYSAGPDGEYDINIGKTPSGSGDVPTPYLLDSGNVNPFQDDGHSQKFGRPLNNEDGTTTDLQHYDNIQNHRLETGRGGT